MLKILLKILLLGIFAALLMVIIAYARGYRLDINQKTLTPTGIVALSSNPKPGKVYINGALKGVTDLNLTLPPGKYSVEIKKDGYTNWSKDINLQGEIVMSLDALLFPKNPSLSPATNLGIIKAVPVGQSDGILLFSQNSDPEKDGIYMFDSNKRPISFFPPLTLLVLKKDLPAEIDFTNTSVHFSADYSQAIVDFQNEEQSVSYLIALDDQTTEPFEVSASRDTLLEVWKSERNKEIAKILETFPEEIVNIASDSFHIISFSPDETKLLYKANNNTLLPYVITPPLIGANQTPEERNIRKGVLYVYDRKEDKNIILDSVTLPSKLESTPQLQLKNAPKVRTLTQYKPSPIITDKPAPMELDIATDGEYPIMWYPDSKHFVVEQEKDIVVFDYDGSNKRTLYSASFEKGFFIITTDGKLFILTNLNPQNNTFGDLYEIGIQ
jgi:hypothetical protein